MRGVIDEVELPVCVGEPEGGLPRGAEVDAGDVDASHGDGEERRRGDGPAGRRGLMMNASVIGITSMTYENV